MPQKKHSPEQTPENVVRRIVKLRRHRFTAWEIAQRLSMPPSTFARCLRRHGLGRLTALEPKTPVRRYERERPGELLYIDTKKLARITRPGHRIDRNRSKRVRGAGWEFAHVAVDDHSRVAYVKVLATRASTLVRSSC